MTDEVRSALMAELANLRMLSVSLVETPGKQLEIRRAVQKIASALMAHAEELLACHHVATHIHRALAPVFASLLQNTADQANQPEAPAA